MIARVGLANLIYIVYLELDCRKSDTDYVTPPHDMGTLFALLAIRYRNHRSPKNFPHKGLIIIMRSSNGNIFSVTGTCAGNSLVTGEFPSQKPVTRSFDVFFDLRLNKRLSKQSRGW